MTPSGQPGPSSICEETQQHESVTLSMPTAGRLELPIIFSFNAMGSTLPHLFQNNIKKIKNLKHGIMNIEGHSAFRMESSVIEIEKNSPVVSDYFAFRGCWFRVPKFS